MTSPRRLLPSLASLRALEALDRLGSASAAADDLSLTQGAVSRQIQALERQLGLTLVTRHAKRLTLTPAARTYAAEVREALSRITRASLRLQVAPRGGALNLAILPTFGMRWLVPRLPDFARRHPDVTLDMATRINPVNFALEPFDAALHFGDADSPGTGRLLLRHETVLPVAAPGALARPPTRARDVATLPLLHIQTRPQAWADWFAHHGVDLAGPIPGTIHDQFATITEAARHGLGIALMPAYLVEEDLATGRLVPVWGPPVEARGAYWLLWPDSRADAPALKAFRTWLAEQAEPEDPLPR